jgi:hypothetical protein
MNEKLLNKKRNGMVVMLLDILLEIALIACFVVGIVLAENGNLSLGTPIAIAGGVLALFAWIPLAGLKVLKPQEALVLTLFGNYVGTLKGEGFYWVNPFCTAVNPMRGWLEPALISRRRAPSVVRIASTISSRSGINTFSMRAPSAFFRISASVHASIPASKAIGFPHFL